MPRLIPEQPTFTTTSEQAVWERLRDSLGTDDVLIANLRLTDEHKDHEVDLVVLMPDIGIVAVEVKGGSVWWDDGWRIMRRGHEATIHPVDQARGEVVAPGQELRPGQRLRPRRALGARCGEGRDHQEAAEERNPSSHRGPPEQAGRGDGPCQHVRAPGHIQGRTPPGRASRSCPSLA